MKSDMRIPLGQESSSKKTTQRILSFTVTREKKGLGLLHAGCNTLSNRYAQFFEQDFEEFVSFCMELKGKNLEQID